MAIITNLATSSLKNYVVNGDAETSSSLTTGWSLGTIGTLTNGLPTGIPTFGSGASGNLTLSVVTSGALAGSNSFSYASSAATTQGNMMASNAYTISLEDQAKVLAVKIYYKAQVNPSNANWSGTNLNSFAWAVQDVTNSSWLSSTGNFNFVQSSGVGICTGTVQTNSNTLQIRLCIYNANATSGAATLYLDDIYVGPQTFVMGPAISEMKPYPATPAIGGVTIGNGTIGAFYRQDGDCIECEISVLRGSTTTISGIFTFPLPAGLSIDTNKTNTSFQAKGSAHFYGAASADRIGVPQYNSTTAVSVVDSNGTSWNAGMPMFTNTGDYMTVQFKVPVLGWSSNTVMSADTDTRVIECLATLSSGSQTSSGNAQTISTWTVVKDSHGFFNPATGQYVVGVPGYYSVDSSVNIQANSTGVRYITAVQSGSVSSTVSGNTMPGFIGTGNATNVNAGFYCIPGDIIVIQSFQNSGGSLIYNTGHLRIIRTSGPAVIAATESVNARYTIAGNTALPNGVLEPLNSTYATFTKIRDTHGWFNPATGVYTVGVNGMFRASLRLCVIPATSNAGCVYAKIAQAGSQSISAIDQAPFAVSGLAITANVTDDFYCLAGDTLTLSAYQNNGSAIAIYSDGTFSSFSIERVGN